MEYSLSNDLKLIKNKTLSKEKSSFWGCCPRKLDYLPEEHCQDGIPEKSKDNRIIKPPPCKWWINSPKHNYCFWKFIKDKSNPDGSMKELVQSDLAKLFGWSSAKTHVMLKEAMDELVQALTDHELIGELSSLTESFEFNTIEDNDTGSGFDY